MHPALEENGHHVTYVNYFAQGATGKHVDTAVLTWNINLSRIRPGSLLPYHLSPLTCGR